MKNITKLADLKDLKVVENQEEVKGGFFFYLFKGFYYGYQAPKNNNDYRAPKFDGGKKGGSKKGY